jgi:ubiquinone/menaquinone biosynthesis C-methylase UbiE
MRAEGTGTLHRAAGRGFQAGAEAYTKGRPDYPPEVETWLTETLGCASGARVVDLGAGTGKFTKRLVATDANVVAVEPVEAMRRQFAAALPDIPVLDGQAEAMPLPDGSQDVVICATAFHWFATTAALGEIVRVLRPGGRLGLVWNFRDETVPWVAKLQALLAPHEGDAPRAYRGTWKDIFPFPSLSALVEQRFAHEQTGAPEDVIINRTRSASFVAAMPEAERERVIDQVRAFISEEPALAGKAEIAMPYVTCCYACEKVG